MNYNMETGAIESVISVPICARTVNCDVSEDINVADSFPEVRKVIALKENILSPAKFVGAKSLDFSGSVDYTLIYIGADGRLCSLPFSADYSFSLPIENSQGVDVNEGVAVVSSLSLENSNVRISTPRRLQVRAGIRASVVCFGKMRCDEDLRGIENTSALQRLQLRSECAEVDCESSDIVTLEDDYFIGNESRIIYSDAYVVFNDSYIDGEVVRVSGEAVVKLLVENGESVERVIRKLPFDAETDLEELDIGDGSVLCRVSGNVNELDVEVEEGNAKIEVGIVIEVCSTQNKDFGYTRDIYSTKQKCDAEYKTLLLPITLINKNANITQSERIACEELGLPSTAQIIDVWATGICEGATLENGRYVFRGKVKYKLVYNAEARFGFCEFEKPFKYDAESGSVDVESFCAKVEAANIRPRCDGENLLLESELELSLFAVGMQDVQMLSCASFGEELKRGKNQFVVCFKGEGESAFELGKRYGVPLDDISGEAENKPFVIIER